MNVLVTGSSGFIGSKFVRVLRAQGFNVFCLIRAESNRSELGIHTLVLEENSVAGFESALTEKFDYIFNLAAYGVGRLDQDMDKMFAGNVSFLSNLLRSLSYKPKLVINVGSCAEYGILEENILVDEDRVLAPTNLYGAMKSSSTLINTQLAKDKGLPLINIRLFGVFGEGEAEYRLMPYLIGRLDADLPVELTSGQQQRDLLYIDDVISAFLAVFENTEELLEHDIYNVCSGVPVKVKDYVNFVAMRLKKSLDLLQWGKVVRSDEPTWVVGSNERFRSCTGWEPQYSMEAGLTKAIKQYRRRIIESH